MALEPETTAFLFPGQGSQVVGMGRDLAARSPEAAAVFHQADEVLGTPLSDLCWHGPSEALNDTLNTQPALLTHSVAVLRALQARLPWLRARWAAGHSLGEFSALVAAGALDFVDALRLVRRRGQAMKEAGARSPGGMAAVLGLESEVVERLCREACVGGGTVQVANDNCPGQVVLSGESAPLEKAMELAKTRGAKRALRLAVSVAAHSPLMASGVEQYRAAVDALGLRPPAVPVISNITARPLPDVDAIRAELPAQLTAQVRWTDSIRYLAAQGMTTFVELGSKDVLTTLLKRIDAGLTGLAVGTPETLAQLEAA